MPYATPTKCLPQRVAIIGMGYIGSQIAARIASERRLEVVAVQGNGAPPSGVARVSSPAELEAFEPDVVLEAAHPRAICDWGAAILRFADLMPLSLTAFADDSLYSELSGIAAEHGKRLLIPHGAAIGLSSLRAFREELTQVSITTVKPPSSLSESGITDGVLYDGSTRGACQLFPRNVNSHAAVALAGLGFDLTQSTISVDSSLERARHTVRAQAETFVIEISRETIMQGVSGVSMISSVLDSLRHAAAGSESICFV